VKVDDIHEVENYRKILNWSKVDISEFFDTSNQTYGNWVNRQSLPKKFYRQARWLITESYDTKLTPIELREQCLADIANPGNLLSNLNVSSSTKAQNVEDLVKEAAEFSFESIGRAVPILAWKNAEQWESEILIHRTKQLGTTTCPVPNSELTFALIVENDEMYYDGERLASDEEIGIPVGSIIFVDPALRSNLGALDKVIARHGRDGEITFRNYHPANEDSEFFLAPINANHDAYTDNIEIIGKVIGYFNKL
jgi:SOS-response transcriptional repressor LexA